MKACDGKICIALGRQINKMMKMERHTKKPCFHGIEINLMAIFKRIAFSRDSHY